jgi:hypothetical protein
MYSSDNAPSKPNTFSKTTDLSVKNVFGPALETIGSSGLFGPTSFQGYAKQHGYNVSRKTCELISKDAIESLPMELRASQSMVLRLGSAADGRGTAFAIVKVPDLRDFFLMHEKVFSNEPETFSATGSETNLMAFRLLPKLTETSLVNLALASGVLGSALQIDSTSQVLVPATGQSTYSFTFQPHQSVPTSLTHNRGQVEIDALFFAPRNGKECLFLVEAKTGNGRQSLAKHKLVYPVLALRREIPRAIPIVPVYLHVERSDREYRFHVAECELVVPAETLPVLCDLRVVSNRTLVLPSFSQSL